MIMEASNSITIMFLVLILLSSVGSLRAASDSGNGYQELVRNECRLTRYPALCVQTLSDQRCSNNHDIMSSLVNKTIFETNLPHSYWNTLATSSAISPETQSVVDYCQEMIQMSSKRLNQALEALQASRPESRREDILTFLSAALTYHETCRDTIQEHGQSNSYMSQIYAKMDYLSQLASNPLALANRIPLPLPKGKLSRRLLNDDFPDWVSPSQRRLLQTTGIRADAVVAKDGSGNFQTVGAAIAAASGGRFVIYVKAGTYNERIITKKDGITLIGEGKYSTVITAGKSVGEGSTLRGSATFTIGGDGFIARDIGFSNTAGPESHQAVAVTVLSDHAVFYRCSIAGYQDTLYAHSLRQFYRECDIYGTVDFIFGNAAAVFQSCTMILRRPRSGGAFNTVMANGRTDPGQNTGFSIHNSKITVGSDFAPVKGSYDSYLGRPWKAYSRAVVLLTNIDGEISPRGWSEWEGAGGSTYRTLYFAEYGNMGPGAGTSGRVRWPGFHVLGTAEASKFTVANFIGGNAWLPSTGVTFVSGL